MTEAARNVVEPPSKPGGSLRRGTFISFEGTEGSGKTTQMRLLVERLRTMGLAVTENQEPGATTIGSQIRSVLLDPAHQEMAPKTELLLMFASRTQAAAEIILPALERGEIVVSDRFTDSTLAYQGAGRGLGFETVMEVHRLALGDLLPDITICTDVDVELGLARARRRNATRPNDASPSEARLDQHSVGFHLRVAEAYRQIARSEPRRFRMVDGSGQVSFAGTMYRAGRAWRGKEVEICIVAGSVQMTYQGTIVRTQPIRHDRTKEHGAYATPHGRPRKPRQDAPNGSGVKATPLRGRPKGRALTPAP